MVCIGLHRKSRKFITCVISVTHIENFRSKVAYHPEVVRRLKEDERCWFQTQQDAENWAAAFPGWQEIWLTSKNSSTDEPSLGLVTQRLNLPLPWRAPNALCAGFKEGCPLLSVIEDQNRSTYPARSGLTRRSVDAFSEPSQIFPFK
jgi:hypothetical protein